MEKRKSPEFSEKLSLTKLKILTVSNSCLTSYLWIGYSVRCSYFKVVGFIRQAIFVKKMCNVFPLSIMIELKVIGRCHYKGARLCFSCTVYLTRKLRA